jgi:hypothetical protein
VLLLSPQDTSCVPTAIVKKENKIVFFNLTSSKLNLTGTGSCSS